MTAWGCVILSAAKDLWRAFVQPPSLTWPGGLLGNHQLCLSTSPAFQKDWSLMNASIWREGRRQAFLFVRMKLVD